jgi:hypothetical protein
MGFLKISPAGTTTLVQFAGDVMNKLSDLFSGINIAQTDDTNKPDVATEIRFRDKMLRLFDNDRSHEFYFDTSSANLSEHKKIRMPALVATEDEPLFVGQPAIVSGKTLDFNNNTFLNFPTQAEAAGGFIRGGLISFDGDGTETVFEIPHTLDPQPEAFTLHPVSAAALTSAYLVSIDATNIVITYQGTAPPSGTDNVQFLWAAGYIQDVGPPGGLIQAGAVATFSGTGSQTIFLIPHGGNGVAIPTTFFALPSSIDAMGNHTVDADDTNIIVTYAFPPPPSTDNVKLVWGAGVPTSTVMGDVQGQRVSDALKFKIQNTPPADPATDEIVLWAANIDPNNQGFFMKYREQGAVVTRRLFP